MAMSEGVVENSADRAFGLFSRLDRIYRLPQRVAVSFVVRPALFAALFLCADAVVHNEPTLGFFAFGVAAVALPVAILAKFLCVRWYVEKRFVEEVNRQRPTLTSDSELQNLFCLTMIKNAQMFERLRKIAPDIVPRNPLEAAAEIGAQIGRAFQAGA